MNVQTSTHHMSADGDKGKIAYEGGTKTGVGIRNPGKVEGCSRVQYRCPASSYLNIEQNQEMLS